MFAGLQWHDFRFSSVVSLEVAGVSVNRHGMLFSEITSLSSFEKKYDKCIRACKTESRQHLRNGM